MLDDCPFGVAAALADDLPGHFRKVGIGQKHHVQVDEGSDIGQGVGGFFLQRFEFVAHPGHGGVEARDFLIDLARCDEQV